MSRVFTLDTPFNNVYDISLNEFSIGIRLSCGLRRGGPGGYFGNLRKNGLNESESSDFPESSEFSPKSKVVSKKKKKKKKKVFTFFGAPISQVFTFFGAPISQNQVNFPRNQKWSLKKKKKKKVFTFFGAPISQN